MAWKNEIESKKRFEFGSNWASFLENITEKQIVIAKNELYDWLGDIRGKTFLDIGSGSGIHSLAARMLGAKVYSFDYDEQSYECTKYLKEKYYKSDKDWTVEKGSILDEKYISSLGEFDIIYSWGVLHHTGDMWKALEYSKLPVKDSGGRLYIAIYNDQGTPSKIWSKFKKQYVQSGAIKKHILLYFMILYFESRVMFGRLVRGRNPFSFQHWRDYKKERGMSRMHDYIDWAGGYPFEVAKPEEIFEFYRKNNFELEKMFTCGSGLGCNLFLFKKK